MLYREYTTCTQNPDVTELQWRHRVVPDRKTNDAFAKHFVQHFRTQPKDQDVRALCYYEVLKKINPFIFMKKVRKNECLFFAAEKWEIVMGKMKEVKFLNENFEIYDPCKHRTRFHRFRITDEHQVRCEKSPTAKKFQNVGDPVLCREISLGVRDRVQRIIHNFSIQF